MTFRENLTQAAHRNGSLLSVGLDPDPALVPPEETARYLCAVIEATSDLVCAYKANLAFYEQLGEIGYAALRAVLRAVPEGVPVIADAKRGDVPHTAHAYARALFDELGFDAVTVNPYLGGDSVEPFVQRAEKGIFVVCRTSNAGAGDLQDLPVVMEGESRPLFEAVALLAQRWNTSGNVGLVAGATYPEELARLRALCPNMLFLLPGVGAQGGDLEAAVRAGLDARGEGIVVNASRSVLFASTGDDFAGAARAAAQTLRDAIEEERRALVEHA